MKRILTAAALLLSIAALVLLSMTAFAQNAFPGFNNKTHTPEAQPFAELSEQVWDLMAAKASSITAMQKFMTWMSSKSTRTTGPFTAPSNSNPLWEVTR